MSQINLFNEDCVQGMKKYPDGYFDVAIVDPPYNVGASNGSFGRGSKKSGSKYRKDLEHYSNANSVPDKEYFDELFRVSKNQIIWGSNYYPQYLKHSGAIVWDKMKDYNKILSDCELAFQSFDKMVKVFRHQWCGFAKSKGSFEEGVRTIIHPNQKPVALYRWCLENYAKKGDKILDTHIGSASIAIACEELGFDLWGFELNEKYFNSAVERVENYRKNQGEKLF